MKKWANNNWKVNQKKSDKPKYIGKRFSVQYFYSFSEIPLFKVVRAKDSQEAIAKFQQAVKWDYDKIGKIEEVK